MEMKKYKLGNLGNVCMCKRILKEQTNSISGIPFFKIGTFGGEADVFIDRETFESYKKLYNYPKKGDVLISAAGTIGRTVIFDGTESYFQDSNIVWIANDESQVLNKYLFYCYKNIKWFTSKGSTILRLYNDNIKNSEIVAPSLSEQGKIISVLSSLDDKIALNNRINAKLEQMAKRLYDYWFVQFDFPVSCHSELVSESHSEEMLNQVQHDERTKPYKSSGGKMEYNEVLKREIPVGWEVGILSDIANITMGQSPEGSSYNEDGKGTIFYQGSTDFGIRFPTVRMYTTEPTRFAKKGDILMSVRAPVGAVNIANTDCCIGRGLAALNSKIGSITYLWYLMDVFKHTFENKNAAGTTFGSITKDELFNLPVVIPQKEIISAFNEKTFSIFNYQLSIEKETQKLTALRDRLLPLLMNGQVEVK
ncbi:MAG: restriction endonuclease subunit S [Spirochaetia bacterium]|nr:restriction endonuclease subunit S [Spirochaetia bacterium]